MRSHCVVMLAALFISAPASAVLSVDGSYPTHVTLVAGKNTCGSVTVQDNLTAVSHSAGAHALSLTHAGNTYQGSVDDNGAFATTAKTLAIGNAQYTIVIDGVFIERGLSADVTVQVRQSVQPTSCSYVVRWSATKDGDPNSVPGEPRDGRALLIRHYAGTGVEGSADGAAKNAGFAFPIGLAMDRSGNLYVADGNGTVRRITRAGTVSTIAGSPNATGFVDAVGSAARFGGLHGIVVDSHGNLFVTDNPNHAVRRIAPDGTVTTFVGNGRPGSADGRGSAAQLNFPHDLTIDAQDNLYVADVANHLIRKITPDAVMTTVSGRALQRGDNDGRGTQALFNFPSSMAIDPAGKVWVGGNGVIRSIDTDGTVTTVAGSPGVTGTTDGDARDARFSGPEGLVFDAGGTLYISSGRTIRRMDGQLRVTTVAGVADHPGDSEGIGSLSRLSLPLGLVVSPEGRIFAADAENNRLFAAIPDNFTCVDSDTRLCLQNHRFLLTAHARDQRTGTEGEGLPLRINSIFGSFSLPALTGSSENPEIYVKVLDGRVVNGSFWTFYGGLTDLEYTLTIIDSITGSSVAYFHEPGSKCGGFDTGALPAPPDALMAMVSEESVVPAAPCGNGALCLQNGRFRVIVHARDQRTGNEGDGVPMAGTSDLFGLFSLPALTGDENNAEIFVKILDGRTVNGKFWVFYGGLTDLEYTMVVTDTETNRTLSFSHAPGSKCGDFNTGAF
jgi:sugar lactone lactonase YvrE